MDNGLIFPYRRRTAQLNPVMLSARSRRVPSGDLPVERVTRSGSRQAMG
jgi:hypothetical protein